MTIVLHGNAYNNIGIEWIRCRAVTGVAFWMKNVFTSSNAYTNRCKLLLVHQDIPSWHRSAHSFLLFTPWFWCVRARRGQLLISVYMCSYMKLNIGIFVVFFFFFFCGFCFSKLTCRTNDNHILHHRLCDPVLPWIRSFASNDTCHSSARFNCLFLVRLHRKCKNSSLEIYIYSVECPGVSSVYRLFVIHGFIVIHCITSTPFDFSRLEEGFFFENRNWFRFS